jgi:sigma-B regulation protein RsbU (phosphoserine phosphatase)
LSIGDSPAVETILKDISDIVRSLDDAQLVMDELVRMTTGMLGVGNCSLVLIEANGQDMRMGAAYGLSPDIMRNYRQKVGEGITGWVAKTGQPLLIEDVENHPLFQRKSNTRYNNKSLLSVPLLRGKRVVGVLNVNNKNDGSVFSRSDELLLSVLANFVVIAIEKAQLRERLRDQERYEADLRVARQIQERILPTELPARDKWEFAARNVPAHAVAGDFFDIIPLPGDRTCIVLGDVCGKGVPAALYMARVLSYFRVVTQLRDTPDGIMAFVNDLLAAEWSERTFVTATLCVIENHGGKISFCSAGHPVPYRVRESTGEVLPAPIEHGLPLGIEAGVPFQTTEMDAASGDTFVLYTDGITEARGPDGSLFREERLCDVLHAHCGTAEACAQSIVAAMQKFTLTEAQSDDITFVVVRRT